MKSLKIFLVMTALLAGCSTTRPVLPDKALVEVQSVTEAIQITRDTDAQADSPAPDGKEWFMVEEGPSLIVITAPHGTKPFREGQYRFSDGGGTAALARMLGKLTGSSVIYTLYASSSDPNFYDNNAFKEALKNLISRRRPVLLLDIHGSHAFRPYDVDLGTMGGASLLGDETLVPDLVAALRGEGLLNISYNYFPASKNETITRFAAALGVPAMQLEISTTWLIPADGPLQAHRFSQTLQALVKFIEAQKKRPAKSPSTPGPSHQPLP